MLHRTLNNTLPTDKILPAILFYTPIILYNNIALYYATYMLWRKNFETWFSEHPSLSNTSRTNKNEL